jgi:hypothetical protein
VWEAITERLKRQLLGDLHLLGHSLSLVGRELRCVACDREGEWRQYLNWVDLVVNLTHPLYLSEGDVIAIREPMSTILV